MTTMKADEVRAAGTAIPRRIIPADSRICPGSVFVPFTGQDRCLCGQERRWHLWEDRNGMIRAVQSEEG